MFVETLQSQMEALHVLVAKLNVCADVVRAGDKEMTASLEKMSAITEKLLSATDTSTERRLAIQYAVMRALAEAVGANEAYYSVLRALSEAAGAELGILWLFDRDAGLLYAKSIWQTAGKPGNSLAHASHQLTLSPGQNLPGIVYQSNQPAWIPDAISHPGFNSLRKEAALASGLHSALLLPIRKEGEVLGVIECFSYQAQQPSVDLIEMLDALGNQIGEFMEYKYAEDLTNTRVHQQSVVATIGRRALMGIDFQELLDETAELVAKTLSVDFSEVLELIPGENRLLVRAGLGWKEGLVGHAHVDAGLRSQAGYLLSMNNPVIMADLSKETRFQPSPLLAEHKVFSGLSVVIPGRFQPFGILSAYSTRRHVFSEDDIDFLQGIAQVLAAVIQREEIEEELRLSRHEIAVVLGGIDDGVIAQDHNGKPVYANESAARILGYASAAEFMNTSISRVFQKIEMCDEQGEHFPLSQLPGLRALRGEASSPVTIRIKNLETYEEHWLVIKAQPLVNENGRTVMAVNIFQDVTDLKRTELSQRLLGQFSTLLETFPDYETQLTGLAQLLVPHLADWCAVDILDEKRILQRVGAAHINPEKVKLAQEIRQRYPPDPNAATGPYHIIRTNQSLYIPGIAPQAMDRAGNPEYREILHEFSFVSIIQVPLLARAQAIGVLTLVRAESARRYTPADLALAEDLGRRAGLAFENAHLYVESQRLNATLEQGVEKRTLQLQKSYLSLKQENKEHERAEKKIRNLNAKLERRVVERTLQLEDLNRDLRQEVLEGEQIDKALQLSMQKMRELYEISQHISLVRTPEEVLKVLLSSDDLKSVSRASVAIFDMPWQNEDEIPATCTIVTDWSKDPDAPLDTGKTMPVPEFVLAASQWGYEPFILADIRNDPRIPEPVRQDLLEMGVASSAIFPLVARGERYGLLSLHFEEVGILDTEGLRYLRGLVDQTAAVIYNFRLLEGEATGRHEAEEANKLKLKFLAMVSHELRTPLTSIKGFASTMLAEDLQWQPETQREFIETIDTEADKLTDLIEQLLDLSRLEAGTLRIVTRSVTWDEILSTAMPQLQALRVDHNLVVEENPDLPPMKVDAARVSQVITNLVNNAVKYSPPHTTITVSAAKLSERLVKVCVSDEGPGIPLEARSRIFEPFQQLAEQGGAGGAGLGLAICRGLVEAHGGNIWVDEHDGTGTTISFTLPID